MSEFLKEPLGDALYEQVMAKLKDSKIKLADLSSGQFVSLEKHNGKVTSMQATIDDLNAQMTKRNVDLEEIKKSLKKAEEDSKGLPELQARLQGLQKEYSEKSAEFEANLKKQRREFVLREKSSALKFSSESAKRAFFNDVLAKDFKFEGDKDEKVVGFDEFLAEYKKGDPAAFIDSEEEDKDKPEFSSGRKGGEGGKPAPKKFEVPILM